MDFQSLVLGCIESRLSGRRVLTDRRSGSSGWIRVTDSVHTLTPRRSVFFSFSESGFDFRPSASPAIIVDWSIPQGHGYAKGKRIKTVEQAISLVTDYLLETGEYERVEDGNETSP